MPDAVASGIFNSLVLQSEKNDLENMVILFRKL